MLYQCIEYGPIWPSNSILLNSFVRWTTQKLSVSISMSRPLTYNQAKPFYFTFNKIRHLETGLTLYDVLR